MPVSGEGFDKKAQKLSQCCERMPFFRNSDPVFSGQVAVCGIRRIGACRQRLQGGQIRRVKLPVAGVRRTFRVDIVRHCHKLGVGLLERTVSMCHDLLCFRLFKLSQPVFFTKIPLFPKKVRTYLKKVRTYS
jgi:hypothetical protein